MSVLPEILAANERYVADFGAKGSLALPPARHFTILTCMDARLDPSSAMPGAARRTTRSAPW